MQTCQADPLLPLLDLPVLPFRVQARALDPLALPEHAASSLRGAFGTALRRLVCVRPGDPDCAVCAGAPCVYRFVFAPKADPGQPGAAGFTDLPRPYVIRPGSGRSVAPGEPLSWTATLVGRAVEQLPYFVLAWHAMGQDGLGRGRGRFQVEQVEALDLDGNPGAVLFDRATGRLDPPDHALGPAHLAAWTAAHAWGEVRALEVRFLTPTSLRHQGKPVRVPEFALLWRAVQLRLSLLRLAHGEGRPDVDFRATIAQAEAVRLSGWTATEAHWERFSHRQGQRVPMHGFLGTARYDGDLTPFLPALQLGTLVGVGDNCTFGQGAYALAVVSSQ